MGGEFLDFQTISPHVWDSAFLGGGKNSGPPCIMVNGTLWRSLEYSMYSFKMESYSKCNVT